MNIKAQWIWLQQSERNPYNQTILARQQFQLAETAFDHRLNAQIAITADSWFRLFINDEWVCDGPCRSYPEHYQYDRIDITQYLQPGNNTIGIIARYFGSGTFHQIPQEAGLLAQVEVKQGKKLITTVQTDDTWECADAKGWIANTPKNSIQMEPAELYNACFAGKERFGKAQVLYNTEAGPWKDLNPRDCALLTRDPVRFTAFREAHLVAPELENYCFASKNIVWPGLIEANHNTTMPYAVATVINAPKAMTITIESTDFEPIVNGKRGKKNVFELRKGDNLLLAFLKGFGNGHKKEHDLQLKNKGNATLRNPVEANHENPWAYTLLTDAPYINDDMVWISRKRPERQAHDVAVRKAWDSLKKAVTDTESFLNVLGEKAHCLPSKSMLLHNPYLSFLRREVLDDAADQVDAPEALIFDHGAATTIHPTPKGDIELVYDLGVQRCGYYDFDLIAPKDTIVDIYGVEYINRAGKTQHTGDYRNGMRYVCKEGVNRFTSLKRRAGRYLYITLRNLTAPMKIRMFRVIESTYPVHATGSFSCSDASLDQIWKISERTLKLCMEDVFTDCPLYEQTLWVGDARNEGLYALTAYNSLDLLRRCINLPAQSLERFPMVGCQLPSGWECLLPAWSFLWGIAVQDYYFHTADKTFLRECWPYVMQNLRGAEANRDERGLFSGPFWNMFDWSGIDDRHDTVLHCSMLMVGAINAALEGAAVLGKKKDAAWLTQLRGELVTGVNKLWDETRPGYPDSIHNDGKISDRSSVHTLFLATLYDIIPEDRRDKAVSTLLDPPEKFVKVGAPFAIQYYYEALEKAGRNDKILESIYTAYLPMLQDGATTVWEMFPHSDGKAKEYPTRSHCHAWSSAPIHFLNRIILGIIPTQPGGKAYTISPHLADLHWASGASASLNGAVNVRWERQDDTLAITATAAAGVKLQYAKNKTHAGMKVVFNGKAQA